jgi:8-oxo-dGTP pyrophosphatase MutT (NUDIX family)
MSSVLHPDVARLASALAARAPKAAERDEPFGEAAVALVLHPGASGLETLLIRRATREGDPWSGQMALPGGRRNANEPSLADTAVRETFEETGLDLAAHGELLGELDEVRPRTPLLPPIIVRPYVFAIPDRPVLRLNHEVAEAFWAPLAEVFDPARTREVAIYLPGGGRMRRQAIEFGEHMVWGMTEIILRNLEGLCR